MASTEITREYSPCFFAPNHFADSIFQYDYASL